MKESIHTYFKLGTLNWMSFPPKTYDWADSMRLIAKDAFFDAVEITSIASEEKRAEVKKILEQSHIEIGFGAQPVLLGGGLNPNALDEAERQRAEAALVAAIDEAREMGANTLSFLAGKWSEDTKEEAYRQLLHTTVNICSYAAGFGMNIELEVFDYDVDKSALIGPAPLAAKFAADVREKVNNFGLLVDLSHIPITHETPLFVVRTLRPYITHFHIGNAVVKQGCNAYGDKHPRFGFPNSANDTPQLTEFFKILKSEGFFNADTPYTLSIEVTPFGDEDAELVVASTKRVINRAWAMA